MAKRGRGEQPKTNAARMLDQAGVAYALQQYEVGDVHLSAAEVAAQVGVPVAHVFKTLVVRGDRAGPLFAVVPADCELELKALARVSGNKRVELVSLPEVTALTGYVRGGTTVLASRKPLPAYLHESALGLAYILVSAGRRGQQLRLAPEDYVRATRATVADIAQPV